MDSLLNGILGGGAQAPVQDKRDIIGLILGESGVADRADQKPDMGEESVPPVPNAPDDGEVSSMADLMQSQKGGPTNQVDTVYNMWKSGSRYDVAKFLLNSDFLYRDFVFLIFKLGEADAVELGDILDEVAPEAKTPEPPVDEVSAESDVPLDAGIPSDSPSEPLK